MTHKVFKVLNLYYIHLDNRAMLCPLADFIDSNYKQFCRVEEVKYNPRAQQGVVVVKIKEELESPMIFIDDIVKCFRSAATSSI